MNLPWYISVVENRLIKIKGQRANICSLKIPKTFAGFNIKNLIRMKKIIVTTIELIKPSRRKITSAPCRPVCTSMIPSKCVEDVELITPARTIKMNPKTSKCLGEIDLKGWNK